MSVQFATKMCSKTCRDKEMRRRKCLLIMRSHYASLKPVSSAKSAAQASVQKKKKKKNTPVIWPERTCYIVPTTFIMSLQGHTGATRRIKVKPVSLSALAQEYTDTPRLYLLSWPEARDTARCRSTGGALTVTVCQWNIHFDASSAYVSASLENKHLY